MKCWITVVEMRTFTFSLTIFPSPPQKLYSETNLLPQWAKINYPTILSLYLKDYSHLDYCSPIQENGIFTLCKRTSQCWAFSPCSSSIITPQVFFPLEHLVYCYVNVYKNWNTNIYLCFRKKNEYFNTFLSKSALNENQQLTKNPQDVYWILIILVMSHFFQWH